MTKRLAACLQVLMVILVLGMNVPMPAAALSCGQGAKSCCASGMICHCPDSKPCSQNCKFTQGASEERCAVVASTTVALPRIDRVLFSLSLDNSFDAARQSMPGRIRTNASPPLIGCQHQAVLRLWLI